MARSNRDYSIDALRGLSILLVVAYHSVNLEAGESATGGLSRKLYHFYFAVDPIIMPLFALISGYVYAFHPFKPGDSVGRFIWQKIRRLMVPMIIAAVLMLLLRGPGSAQEHAAIRNRLPTPRDILHVAFFSYEYFWFVQALFLVFLAMALLDGASALRTPVRWLGWFALALIANFTLEQLPSHGITVPRPDFFSYWGFVYLLPSFLVGYALYRFHWEVRRVLILFPALLLAIVCLVLQELAWRHAVTFDLSRSGPFGMTLGITVGVCLLMLRRNVRPLVPIGLSSYAIYLYHGFGLAIGLRIADAAFKSAPLAVFALKLLIAVALPMVLEWLVRRSKILSQWVLGL